MLEILMNNGIDVNHRDQNESAESPLAAAVLTKSKRTIEFLLQHDVDVNLQRQDPHGSAMAAAALICEPDGKIIKILIHAGAQVNLLLKHGSYGSALAAANHSAWYDKNVPLLLNHGANVTLKFKCDDFGTALIVVAAAYKFSKGMEQADRRRPLINCDADTNPSPKMGKYGYALAVASCISNLSAARLLIDHGAEVDAILHTGDIGSALVAAINGLGLVNFENKKSMVLLLSEYGANINTILPPPGPLALLLR
ncbi:hypothetical protein EG329_002089 [Mollisiaceae sp. DMI_Dod_QoI]|nr:hypothetical protein EG329_002089 [Helotiales sp. DMI_Dod_QoI]